MAEVGPITLLMLKHHGIVNKFLMDFEKNKEDKKARNLFDIFRWSLEKHFSIEEKHIFIVTDKGNKTELNQLQNLLKDHRDLRIITDNIAEDILEKRKPNVSILKELLFAHEKREVESFYPRFDRRLSEEEKEDILEKVNETKFR